METSRAEANTGTCTAIFITGTRDFITKMPGCLFSVDQMTMLYLKAPHPLSPRDSPPSMTGISHLSTGSTSSFNWTVHDIIGDTCTITNSWAGHFGTVHDIMISYDTQSHICLPGHFGVIEYLDSDILWLKRKAVTMILYKQQKKYEWRCCSWEPGIIHILQKYWN